MAVRKVIGYALLCSPLFAVFVAMMHFVGIAFTLLIWAIGISGAGAVVAGIWLLEG